MSNYKQCSNCKHAEAIKLPTSNLFRTNSGIQTYCSRTPQKIGVLEQK